MQDPLSRWFQSLRLVPFVLAMLAMSYVAALPFMAVLLLFPTLAPEGGPRLMHELGFAGKLFLGSVVAPIVETAIFQWAPMRLLGFQGRTPWSVYLFVSATAFSLAHSYSLGYVMHTFFVGLALAYCYALCVSMRRSPFWVTSGIHALRNLVATLFVLLSENAA